MITWSTGLPQSILRCAEHRIDSLSSPEAIALALHLKPQREPPPENDIENACSLAPWSLLKKVEQRSLEVGRRLHWIKRQRRIIASRILVALVRSVWSHLRVGQWLLDVGKSRSILLKYHRRLVSRSRHSFSVSWEHVMLALQTCGGFVGQVWQRKTRSGDARSCRWTERYALILREVMLLAWIQTTTG